MNNIIKVVVTAVCMLYFYSTGAFAIAQQSGFRWGKFYNGWTSQGTSYDQLNSSVTDSVGNTYIFGAFGRGAKIDGVNICPIDADTSGTYLNCIANGIFLAKIDSLGNMLWIRSAIGSDEYDGARAMNMILKDNRLTIAFDYRAKFRYSRSWFYFFDTLITEPSVQFPNTFAIHFVTFDLDGNRLEHHLFQIYAQADQGSDRMKSIPIYGEQSRFCIDTQNNIHLFMSTFEFGEDSAHQAHIIIDGDTNRRYLFLPDNTSIDRYPITTTAYIILDSNWNIVQTKKLITRVDSWQFEQYGFQANLNFSSILLEDDNIYLNGALVAPLKSWLVESLDTPFYATVFIDSVHYLKVDNMRDFQYLPFLMKLDLQGNIIWMRQLYSASPDDVHFNFRQTGSLALDNECVYMQCKSCSFTLPGYVNALYVDSAHQIRIESDLLNFTVTVAYNRETGEYVRYYLIDTAHQDYTTTLLSVGDELIMSPTFELGNCYSNLCKINKQTGVVSMSFPVRSDMRYQCLSSSSSGHIFRGGHTHGRTYVDDSIFLGTYWESAVMLFYYDSALDQRPRPCPTVDTLWIINIDHHTATLSWRSDPKHVGYELAYAPEGEDWDNATLQQTTDTTLQITMPDDRCYQFRVRGLCDGIRAPYGDWSDSVTACPLLSIDQPDHTNRLTLSPNPATDNITINSNDAEIQSIEILDINGSVVATYKHTTQLDISTLPQGMYFAKVQMVGDSVQYLKFTKK